MQVLSKQELQARAPSIFAEQPYSKVSDKYEFIPTIKVLDAMIDHGFHPVSAGQTSARNPERAMTNRHLIRFRHEDYLKENNLDVGDNIPEIALYNSHNGSCAYRLLFGIFRLVCSNGLVVASSNLGELCVTHRGNIIEEVLDASFGLIERAPEVAHQINQWQGLILNPTKQLAFAKDVRDFASLGRSQVEPESLIEARRPADDCAEDGSRDLWKTMNVVQENLIKGGQIYTTADGKTRTSRQVKAVHADELINRRLWTATEAYADRLAA